jgi:hypothetical protein
MSAGQHAEHQPGRTAPARPTCRADESLVGTIISSPFRYQFGTNFRKVEPALLCFWLYTGLREVGQVGLEPTTYGL